MCQVTDAWCQATEEDIALSLSCPTEGRAILSSVQEEQEVTFNWLNSLWWCAL